MKADLRYFCKMLSNHPQHPQLTEDAQFHKIQLENQFHDTFEDTDMPLWYLLQNDDQTP